MDYLRHVIHLLRLEVSKRMIDTVRRFEHSTSMVELRSLFRCSNVFRRLVPNIACVAILLNKKIQKAQLQTFDGLSNE